MGNYEANGLLSGLANGIKEGMITYQNSQNIQHQQKMQELMAGVTKDENGNLTYTPEAQAHRQAGLISDQQAIEANSADSDKSMRMATARNAFAKTGNPKLMDPFSGLSANEQKDVEGLGKADISGNFGLLGKQFSPLIGIRRDALEETKSQHASEAGNKINRDPIIMAASKNIGSLKRSLSILDNPNKPVTTKDINLAYTDYINAVAAGGAATEGKIIRELPETWALDWNALKQKAGVNDDLRNDAQARQLISMLRENINTVHHDLRDAAGAQAKSLGANYSQTSNQKQRAIVDAKVKEFTEPSEGLLGESPAAAKLKRLQELTTKAGIP